MKDRTVSLEQLATQLEEARDFWAHTHHVAYVLMSPEAQDTAYQNWTKVSNTLTKVRSLLRQRHETAFTA